MPIENDSKERGADKDNFFAMNLSFNYFADGFAGKRRYQSLKNNFFLVKMAYFKNYLVFWSRKPIKWKELILFNLDNVFNFISWIEF